MDRRRFVQSTLAAAIAASVFPHRGLLAALTRVDADVNAVTGDGVEVTLKRTAVQELADSLRGRLLLPGSEAYDDARRVLNAEIDKHPALIAQCAGAADVANAVDFARAENLLLAVKCGGHSLSGKSTCDKGLMIDLTPLRSVRVDPRRRIAYVSGGSLLGHMDHETMEYGLVTTAGTVSHTGVGGLTLGGGFGRLARKFGLAIDNVRAVDIVGADGKLRHASAEENPELFWAVRGGGGNFGVVTNFEFHLHPMERQVIGGAIAFPMSEAREVMKFFADYVADAPDDLYIDGGLSSRPGEGEGAWMSVCYAGPKNQANKWIDPIRQAGKPVFDGIGVMDYVALQKSSDVSDPRARGAYMKSGFTTGVTQEAIDAILAGFEPHPERALGVAFAHVGGAVTRVPAEATAFPHRYAQHDLLAILDWPVEIDPEDHIAWLKSYWATLEPHTRGFYVNDAFVQSQQQIDKNYLQNHARLVELKNKYDPGNLFRLNTNVRPSI
ncbi:MAG TPA: FAD-binding oxidoreductase [Woeseiaceae bacterium]|nr:FAD-binding oxidoreductase [Woeseiaceae bacterium]